ncbi:unnamed protein product [Caenorhabditis bovis]|uniref:Uncharacterized protein n=1 Tax=Caenorhabditis bovis TaxID=2654633 RepID=A0A8S1EKG2_9PELO|nr:unnamed protein product [Caenorhabditis bovis]
MTSCQTASMPIEEEGHEYCIDILHESHQDNTLPMVSTTPHMPPVITTQDRPVVLYMAPIHKQESVCACGKKPEKPEEKITKGVQNVRI